MDPQHRPKVVIVGAGFAGLSATRALRRAPVAVTLIDRSNHHCFQPLLYQVATAALSPADIAWPIRSILRRQENATTLMAEVSGIDVEKRVVAAGELRIEYDFLVLATGARHSYFGHEDWEPVAPGLKRIEDATRIRRDILLAFERAETEADEAERARLLTFVVVGGGPTGVEMSGAIAEVARHALARDFRHINPRSARIVLLEAGPRLLSAYPAHLSTYAERALTGLGVEVMTGTPVTDVGADGVTMPSGLIEARTVIWAAGVAATSAGRWIEADRDRAGRVLVGPDLSIAARPEIFVVGDTAAVLDREGRPLPGIAPAAKQMGAYVGRVVAARATSRPVPPPFVYRHAGDLATIGRKAAVVKLGRLELTGFVAWLFWGIVHIYFLIGVRYRLIVAISWLWSYVTYQRGARLITNPPEEDGARREGEALADRTSAP